MKLNNFFFKLKVTPFIRVGLPEKIFVRENESIKLECSIGGSPTPSINW